MKFYTEEGNWDLVGNNTPGLVQTRVITRTLADQGFMAPVLRICNASVVSSGESMMKDRWGRNRDQDARHVEPQEGSHNDCAPELDHRLQG
jgi:Catalase